jgi:hypothetical protein
MTYDETPLDAGDQLPKQPSGTFGHVRQKAKENRRSREALGSEKRDPNSRRPKEDQNGEWFTPAAHIERIRAVLGEIDLDPATCEEANETVKATKIYTYENCGLDQPWFGRVFLNPPYGMPEVQQFVNKLVEEVESGRTTEAILLVDNKSETRWFATAAGSASATCLQTKRIRFNKPGGGLGFQPTRGQAWFYFGPHPERFAEVFGPHGIISYPRPVMAAAAQPVIGDLAKTSGTSPPPRVRDLAPEDRAVLFARSHNALANVGPLIENVMAWGDHVLPGPLQPLTKAQRWYVWKWVNEGNPTKLGKPPLQAVAGMRYAANNAPSNWCSYERAKSYVDGGLAHGVGFAMTGYGLCAFDLDHCFDSDGNLYPGARALVERCNSYCEWTPSRDGLRIIGKAVPDQKRQTVINMPEGWNLEVYEAGCARFITVSGKPFEAYGVAVADLGDIVAEHFKGRDDARPAAPADQGGDDNLDWARFCSAVRAIPNDGSAIGVANWNGGLDRDSIWVPLGAVIYRTGHEGAKDLFKEFSEKSPKYHYRDAERLWKSFDRNPNPRGKPWTAGSIYKMAMDNGWSDPDLGPPLKEWVGDYVVTDEELYALFPVEFWQELKRRREQNSSKNLKA